MNGISRLRIGSGLMEKHEKMVLKNKEKSQEKAEKAIAEMHKLLNDEEQVVVCTLVRRTGLSRAFFTIMRLCMMNFLEYSSCKRENHL